MDSAVTGLPLGSALAELEESTARLVSLRRRLEVVAAGLSEKRELLARCDSELATARATAEGELGEISRLEHEVGTRQELLTQLRDELGWLASELGAPGEER